MKIQRISQFQGHLPLSTFQQDFDIYLSSFLETDLGKIYKAIPWQELVNTLGLKDASKGKSSIFSPRGKLALMFLKHYACCSDKKLIAQLNANIDYQFFCDLHIPAGKRLSNFKIVSEIRCELASKLNMSTFQQVLADHWRVHLKNKSSITIDATCYESYVRYPTDIKLLWESVSWLYRMMKKLSRQLGVKLLRTKYSKWKRRYNSYSKKRKPSRKDRRSMNRALLRLLRKIVDWVDHLESLGSFKCPVPKYSLRKATIKQALLQQEAHFFEGIKPIDRIVSIDKAYIRPIVRGKEIKSVEFGAKVHKLQVDGISFIEHLSFDAFNEGIRLKESIDKTKAWMRSNVKVIGADGIYANNANRRYVTQNNIKNDFKRKGKPSKYSDQFKALRKSITKERASRLEGSFGTDKEHFLLNKIKARTQATERLWIIFGIHTSNALKIGRRMNQKLAKAA